MKFTITKYGKPVIHCSLQNLDLLAWVSLWVYHPSFISFKHSYYLFYTGRNMSINRIGMGINDNIGVAISKNLKEWKKMKDPVIRRAKMEIGKVSFSHTVLFLKISSICRTMEDKFTLRKLR